MASISRRQILGQLATAAACLAAPQTDATWTAILNLPRSRSFGITSDGGPRDTATLYRFSTPGGSPLTFDVSNNQILCNFDSEGTLRQACVNSGVYPLANAAMSGGVYTAKLQTRGGPWKVRLGPSGPRGDTAVSLIANTIPEFQWRHGDIAVRQIAFAPFDPADPAKSPRACICIFDVGNTGTRRVAVELGFEGDFELARWFAFGSPQAGIEPGARVILAAAILLEDDPRKLKDLEARLRARPPLQWLWDTHTLLAATYGTMDVPDAPYFGEGRVRFAESCRQSLLRLPDGSFGGGFMGSDIDARDLNWSKDTYHCVLGAVHSAPEYCAAAIPFYFQWGLPAKPIARGLARFPDSGRVTQSLSLAAAPLSFAASYYKFTGDKEYFRRYSGFLPSAKRLTDDILATRRGEPFLFPSMFVSNGDARGHFHTGSNVAAWYAFEGAARIADEVYGDGQLANQWRHLAARIRESILKYCRKPGPLGLQYVEGVFDDSTYVPGHDGEESDTTLMPFYGFCEADDPELVRHAKVGLSPLNPYYAPGLDGIWWHNHGGFRPATAPAWATGLAAADSFESLSARLSKFRELTDLDGSLWWWPYKYGETDRNAILRGNGATKCGWAAGVYLLRFIRETLGLDIDVPSGRLWFRPACPWPSFDWSGCKLGAGRFSVSCRMDASGTAATVENANRTAYEVYFELPVPPGGNPRVLVDGRPQTGWTPGRRYGRGTAIVRRSLQPGQRTSITAVA